MRKLIQDVLTQIRGPRRPGPSLGLLAEFPNPGALLHAVEQVHRAGYRRIDTFTPFPVHGMDRAMGLGPSLLGYLVFGGGVAGAALALLMQWWMGGVDYPINISGKEFFALEPSIPITFEVTVLLSALTAVGGMFALNRLPRPYNPLFSSERFSRATDDGFFLYVESNDARYDETALVRLLREHGAVHMEVLDEVEDGVVNTRPAGQPAAEPSAAEPAVRVYEAPPTRHS